MERSTRRPVVTSAPLAAAGTVAVGSVGSLLLAVLGGLSGVALPPPGGQPPLAGTTVATAAGVLAFVTVDYAPSVQTLHVGFFSTVAVVGSGVGYWILSTRQTRGARLFAATLVLTALRAGVDVFRTVLGELWTIHRALAGAALLVELFAVLTFLSFAGRYADEPALSGPRTRQVLGGVAAVATLVVATNGLHGLVFEEFLLLSDPFVHAGAVFGPLGWAIGGLSLAALLGGAGLLARSFTVAEQPDWWSAAMLTMGICLTAVVVVLDALDQVLLSTYHYGGLGLALFLALTTPALLGHGLRRIEITARESMLRELDDPIVIVDDKRHVVDYTAAAADLLPPDAAGRPFEEVLAVVPEWPPVGEISTTEVDRSEVVRSDEGGGTGHYLMQTSPVTSETGDVIGYTVRFADVTDLKQRTAELARKNEQLDQFANTISSDLREPLRVASEYVELLEDAVEAAGSGGTLDPATVDQYLDTIDQSLQRMQHIIDDLLALARDTDPVSEQTQVQFSEAARDAWDLVDTARGRLRVDGDGTIQADRECFQRVFENVFRAVLDAKGDAPGDDRDAADVLGGSVQVAVGLTEGGFFVTARGPGLPDDHDEITMEDAETAGPAQQRLELSIVEHLSDAHGWDVAVESTDGAIRFEVTGCSTSPDEPLAGEA